MNERSLEVAMPRIKFTKAHASDRLHFWTWRDLNRKLHAARSEDEEQAEQFAERANEVREEVQFLLGAGLSEGAEQALNSLAEADMTDFCILVDLAEPVDIPGVPALPQTTRQHLHQFLDREPWHSLAIDHDITVALALLDQVGATVTNRPWYDYAPHLVSLIARLMDEVNKEQLLRFVGEYNTLAERDSLHLPQELPQVFESLVHGAANRLGVQMPEIRG